MESQFRLSDQVHCVHFIDCEAYAGPGVTRKITGHFWWFMHFR